MDIPIAPVRYFCVLAEELHFRRAAERLHISSPSLSQQITRLEDQLGTRLFDRSARRVTLTPDGARLLPAAERAVTAHREFLDAALLLGEDRDRILRVGVVAAGAGPLTSEILMAAVEAVPGLRLEMRHLGFFDAEQHLIEGDIDVAFALDEPAGTRGGVVAIPVWEERRVLVVRRDHPLASRASVRIMETAGETFITARGGDEETLAWWLIDPRPDGSHPRRGPSADDLDGILDLCAAGVGVNIAGEAIGSRYRRDELALIPISDAPPARIMLKRRTGPGHPLVLRFEEIALERSAARSGPAAASGSAAASGHEAASGPAATSHRGSGG